MIVYKKEAFDKFQSLLLKLKQDFTMYLINFDFVHNAASQVVVEQSEDTDYLHVLQQVSKSAKDLSVKPVSSAVKNSSDDIEVFEVSSQKEPSKYKDVFEPSSKKTKPNDPCPC